MSGPSSRNCSRSTFQSLSDERRRILMLDSSCTSTKVSVVCEFDGVGQVSEGPWLFDVLLKKKRILEEEKDPKEEEEDPEEFPANFKELFLEKYFSIIKQDEKKAEFLCLTQGNFSLVEYERKFDELSHYVPHFVNTEERKARRFEKGLRPELYNAIAVLRLLTYADVL
ncbi:hypothetical protein FNV43_RR07402 [Rhamnella rubrinervis]|uniref:Retrotransposon gag domain-containing protein n=1 Tax=Rhamnella rubrinervis TaxID=2594499 RepID=A0A8K0HEQ2_9ROSA|nr:hypothetical protein FNV43_RR07402 [Rhamnella rubrinervis]